MPSPVDPLRRIAVLRLSALGDVCHTLPVVRTIQDGLPEARVTWIVGKVEARLLEGIDGIELVAFDKSRGLHAYRELRSSLRGRCFDVLLHMQMALRASVAARFVPARTRIGFDRRRAKDFQWLFTDRHIAPRERQHVLDSLFGFAEAIGIRDRSLRWDIPVPEAARERVRTLLGDDAPYVVFSPCSRWAYREWPSERYARVGDHAHGLGLRVVLSGAGTAREREAVARIRARMRNPALDLNGRTGLKELLALLGGARAIVTPDSGPAHLGTAVGTPVVGLYACTNPRRAGPYHSRPFLVDRYPQAVRRFTGRAPEEVPWGLRIRDPRAMELIDTDSVCERLEAALAADERTVSAPRSPRP